MFWAGSWVGWVSCWKYKPQDNSRPHASSFHHTLSSFLRYYPYTEMPIKSKAGWELWSSKTTSNRQASSFGTTCTSRYRVELEDNGYWEQQFSAKNVWLCCGLGHFEFPVCTGPPTPSNVSWALEEEGEMWMQEVLRQAGHHLQPLQPTFTNHDNQDSTNTLITHPPRPMAE